MAERAEKSLSLLMVNATLEPILNWNRCLQKALDTAVLTTFKNFCRDGVPSARQPDLSTRDGLIWKSLSCAARSEMIGQGYDIPVEERQAADVDAPADQRRGHASQYAETGARSHIGMEYLTELEVDQLRYVSPYHRDLVDDLVDLALAKTRAGRLEVDKIGKVNYHVPF